MELKIRYIYYDSGFENRLKKYIKFSNPKDRKKVQDAIRAFQLNIFNPKLDTHKLGGKLRDRWSFSINYSDRIAFRFIDHESVLFMDIGDHDIYK